MTQGLGGGANGWTAQNRSFMNDIRAFGGDMDTEEQFLKKVHALLGFTGKKMLRRTCWKTLLLPRFKKPNAQIPNQLGWPSSIVQLVGLSNWRVQIYNMGCDIGFGIGFCNAGWADDVSSPNINSKMDSEEDSTWKRVGLLHSFQRDVAPCERECTNRRHTFSSKIKLLK